MTSSFQYCDFLTFLNNSRSHILDNIFFRLKYKDLQTCCLVSYSWSDYINKEFLGTDKKKLKQIIDWQDGDISVWTGIAPNLDCPDMVKMENMAVDFVFYEQDLLCITSGAKYFVFRQLLLVHIGCFNGIHPVQTKYNSMQLKVPHLNVGDEIIYTDGWCYFALNKINHTTRILNTMFNFLTHKVFKHESGIDAADIANFQENEVNIIDFDSYKLRQDYNTLVTKEYSTKKLQVLDHSDIWNSTYQIGSKTIVATKYPFNKFGIEYVYISLMDSAAESNCPFYIYSRGFLNVKIDSDSHNSCEPIQLYKSSDGCGCGLIIVDPCTCNPENNGFTLVLFYNIRLGKIVRKHLIRKFYGVKWINDLTYILIQPVQLPCNHFGKPYSYIQYELMGVNIHKDVNYKHAAFTCKEGTPQESSYWLVLNGDQNRIIIPFTGDHNRKNTLLLFESRDTTIRQISCQTFPTITENYVKLLQPLYILDNSCPEDCCPVVLMSSYRDAFGTENLEVKRVIWEDWNSILDNTLS